MKLLDISTPKYPNSFTMIDDEDYAAAARSKWSAIKARDKFYVVGRSVSEGGISLHRFLMGRPAGLTIDHIDGNGLNNQRCNLRVCTMGENARNRGKQKNGFLSKYIGVKYYYKSKRFIARIKINRKEIYIGSFDTEEEAAVARDTFAIRLHGEFARLNFPNTAT